MAWTLSVKPDWRDGSDYYVVEDPDFAWPDGRKGRLITWLAGGMGDAGTSLRLVRDGKGARRDEEIEQHARLIAAAPDLLEALRTFVAEAESYHSKCHDSVSAAKCDSICEALPAGRAAIAKAEGR